MNSPSGLSQCMKYFESIHLGMPFIPSDLESKIVQEEDMLGQPTVFGSKPHTNSVYDINAFVLEAISKPTEDFVTVGTDRQFMHYYAKKHFDGCDLAVFIQIPCGTGSEDVRNKIEGTFLGIKRLLNSMPKAAQNLKPPKNACLLVVESPLYDIYGNGSGWGVINDKSGRIDPEQWHRELPTESVIFGALKAIHTSHK
jgi:hypothetical protein